MILSPSIPPGALDYYEVLAPRDRSSKRFLRRITDTPHRLHRTQEDAPIADGTTWPFVFSLLKPFRGKTRIVLVAQARDLSARARRGDVLIVDNAEERWTKDRMEWSSNGPMYVDGQICDPVGFGLAHEDRVLLLVRVRSEPGSFDLPGTPIQVNRGGIRLEEWEEWFRASEQAVVAQ